MPNTLLSPGLTSPELLFHGCLEEPGTRTPTGAARGCCCLRGAPGEHPEVRHRPETSEHRALKHPLGGDVTSCPSGAASAIYQQHWEGDRAAAVPGEQLLAAAVALGSRWPRWTSSARGYAGLHVTESATASATAFTEQMRCHACDSPVAGLPAGQDFTQRGYKKKEKKKKKVIFFSFSL